MLAAVIVEGSGFLSTVPHTPRSLVGPIDTKATNPPIDLYGVFVKLQCTVGLGNETPELNKPVNHPHCCVL